MQGNWTVCETLKYLILMPDIQEAKCFEFTVQILPPLESIKFQKKITDLFYLQYSGNLFKAFSTNDHKSFYPLSDLGIIFVKVLKILMRFLPVVLTVSFTSLAFNPKNKIRLKLKIQVYI